MDVGVFGGTFDPVHLGHLIVAEEVRVQVGLDRVLFVPAGEPWLKARRPVSAACHRVAMVEAAIAHGANFGLSQVDVARDGPTYTVDTLTELREELGMGARLHLILGMDALNELGRWHEPRRLFQLASLIGVSRPLCDRFAPESLNEIIEGASEKVTIVEGLSIGISGTDIRRRIARGLSIKYLVPEPVERYILDHGLYVGGGRGLDDPGK